LQHIDEVVTPTMDETQRNFTSMRCLMALYTTSLFTRGFGFANDSRQIRVASQINGQPIGI